MKLSLDLSALTRAQAEKIRTALGQYGSEAKTVVEIHGVHGNETTTQRSRVVRGLVAGTWRDGAEDKLSGILEGRLNIGAWSPLERDANVAALLRDLAAAVTEMQQNPVIDDKRITPEEAAARDGRIEASRLEYAARQQAEESCALELQALQPAWASALIVAELRQDDSDAQTDYYGGRTLRRVAIGWRRGAREDFKQLRAAAGGFPETAHMGPGKDRHRLRLVYGEDCETGGGNQRFKGEFLSEYFAEGLQGEYSTRAEIDAALQAHGELGRLDGARVEPYIDTESYEHRENYSMGGGNYLGTSRYGGWCVRSYSLPVNGYLIETEFLKSKAAEPEPVAIASGEIVATGVMVTLSKEKGGIELRFPARPRQATLDKLKEAGWRWSRVGGCWWHARTEAAVKLAEEISGARIEEQGQHGPDVDALYEQQCAAACGPGL